ncbi:hypothetical protein GCM10010919_00980 [Alishewanella longhuensis]|uniref:OmpR/PhoB-type domain-containing protein n=1 Tax=Alishewanella longhuensis TaxID=1091037 RepID=A0ABQ3KTG9_9ALTE|nr:winged helix-turn-helix domain-containing protein [Alishewanella longhuensis]GHG58913.1 hypothetical protein GCM10010919_00980 [Alishewanella longhuensis]
MFGSNKFVINDKWYFDAEQRTLSCGAKFVTLEKQHAILLVYLVKHHHQVLSKENLLEDNWQGRVVSEENLTVAISRLRKVFDDNPRCPEYIKTIPTVGYQFVATVASSITEESALKRNKGSYYKRHYFAVILLVAMTVAPKIHSYISHTAFSSIASESITQTYDALVAQSRAVAPEDTEQLIRKWQSYVGQFPEHAEAHLQLAKLEISALSWMEATDTIRLSEVTSLLHKAIAFDTEQAEAWSWLARLYFWHKSDYAVAEAYFREALKWQPTAETFYAYAEMLLAQGRFNEANQCIESARQSKPHHYTFPRLAWAYQLSGRTEDAWRELQRIRATGILDRIWHISALRISDAMGLPDESYRSMQWLLQQTEQGKALLVSTDSIYQTQGLPAVYQFLLSQRFEPDIGHYVPPLSWARYAILAGDDSLALVYFKQAMEQRQAPLLWAAVDPVYQPISESPEFGAWLRTIKLAAFKHAQIK